ncbi:LOW QUALITY PROTEIN: hypothetical protein CH63R_11792 [Colletotrichum higginsianum IMI 349063]|uniref:Uncharacterized protein n=1 Tax=Colletotrichum higginsianum (strain IMI 349063) TaxID=759273 RepID=A0A1B7XZC2_COLHI|nr:LOW QUALITY PROTEIN: hypothetical protein CH63R_11792 [Colletotrichum higginsianum IMI 349063]OBR05089.1 LOW QUALITY PROTEIN: hypothetical protein CH63R_11792 [Colletotrichum higginsianum IMI 349063]GJC99719.1 hypothetical protein ColKHC_08545 [Colletotrichum higginsianum]
MAKYEAQPRVPRHKGRGNKGIIIIIIITRVKGGNGGKREIEIWDQKRALAATCDADRDD